MGGRDWNVRVQRTRCSGQELLLAHVSVYEKLMGFADLEVCLARLKSVEQRPSPWIQLRIMRLTSSDVRTAWYSSTAFLCLMNASSIGSLELEFDDAPTWKQVERDEGMKVGSRADSLQFGSREWYIRVEQEKGLNQGRWTLLKFCEKERVDE